MSLVHPYLSVYGDVYIVYARMEVLTDCYYTFCSFLFFSLYI